MGGDFSWKLHPEIAAAMICLQWFGCWLVGADNKDFYEWIAHIRVRELQFFRRLQSSNGVRFKSIQKSHG